MARTGESSRRAFLAKATAATIGTVALAGCGGIFDREEDEESPTPTDEQPARSPSTPATAPSPFESSADLTEYGADPTGNDPIGDAIEEAAAADRLLYLPPGEYRVDEQISISGLNRFGIVGEDATIVPSDSVGSTLAVLRSDEGPLHVENLHFDFTDDGTSVRAIDARAPDGLVLRDLSVAGRLDGGRGPVRVDVTDPDGSGLVEQLQLPDGSVTGESVTGCYVGDENRGEITFRNCHVEGFADNGLYGDPDRGKILVDGGYYANNGISNVRVRAGSVVRNVHVRCDESSRGLDNMRGIRLTNSQLKPDVEPAVVENCRVEMVDVSYSDGGITLDSNLPAAHIRDTEILIDVDEVRAIWAKSPEEELRADNPDYEFDCQNVAITGDSSEGAAIQIDERDGSQLEVIEVIQTGANRNGIVIQRSSENVLRDATFDVSGTPIVLQEATLQTFDIDIGSNVALTKTVESSES